MMQVARAGTASLKADRFATAAGSRETLLHDYLTVKRVPGFPILSDGTVYIVYSAAS
jgi:hypothetical protein